MTLDQRRRPTILLMIPHFVLLADIWKCIYRSFRHLLQGPGADPPGLVQAPARHSMSSLWENGLGLEMHSGSLSLLRGFANFLRVGIDPISTSEVGGLSIIL